MASDKIKAFNSIIEGFLLQLSDSAGTTYLTYFKKAIKINSLIAIENGIVHMLPYKEKIFSNDESYFDDDSTLIDKLNTNPLTKSYSGDEIMSEIFKLKDIYYKLDEVSKTNVWDILKALTQLMVEYCDIKGIKYECYA